MKKFKLSTGVIITLTETGRGTLVNSKLFPGQKLSSMLDQLKAVWVSLGYTWEDVTDEPESLDNSEVL